MGGQIKKKETNISAEIEDLVYSHSPRFSIYDNKTYLDKSERPVTDKTELSLLQAQLNTR